MVQSGYDFTLSVQTVQAQSLVEELDSTCWAAKKKKKRKENNFIYKNYFKSSPILLRKWAFGSSLRKSPEELFQQS